MACPAANMVFCLWIGLVREGIEEKQGSPYWQSTDGSPRECTYLVCHSLLLFIIGWQGRVTSLPALKHLPASTASLTSSSNPGTRQKRPPRSSPACNRRGR